MSEVKIDKSFVFRLERDAADATIVRATIGLAHDLGLRVVAEGVKTSSPARSSRSLASTCTKALASRVRCHEDGPRMVGATRGRHCACRASCTPWCARHRTHAPCLTPLATSGSGLSARLSTTASSQTAAHHEGAGGHGDAQQRPAPTASGRAPLGDRSDRFRPAGALAMWWRGPRTAWNRSGPAGVATRSSCRSSRSRACRRPLRGVRSVQRTIGEFADLADGSSNHSFGQTAPDGGGVQPV